MNRYVIGVDAGGTKTTAQAFLASNGTPLSVTVGDFGNVTVDFDRGLAHIIETTDALIAQTDGTCIFLCVGCAGVETGDKKARMQAALNAHYPDISVFVTNDAILALYGALKGKDGVLVIAGTGSIGYAKVGKETYRAGGWGHLLSDKGSGYSIVIDAFTRITRAFDERHSDTPLVHAVFDALNITELRSLIDFTYKSTKGEIAALMPLIEQLANEGDTVCQSILNDAADALADLAILLCRQNDLHTVAVSGSVLTKCKPVFKRFAQKLNEEINDVQIINEPFDARVGAYNLFKTQSHF